MQFHRGHSTSSASSSTSSQRPLGRRALLTGGVAAVGGAIVAQAGSSQAATLAPPAVPTPPGAVSLTLNGTDWRFVAEAPPVGGDPTSTPTQLTTAGNLVDGSGDSIGSFRSTPLVPGSAGPDLHILTFTDGVLLALGSGSLDEGNFAIVGGTGSYLGATGGYTVRQSPLGRGGDGTALFLLTLLSAESRPQTALGAAPVLAPRS